MLHLLPENGRFYKANLHNHTTLSDGKMTPEETKAAYLAEGYSIVAFTDHEVIIPHPELADENFLPLTGFEIAVNKKGTKITYHINLIAKAPDNIVSSAFRESGLWKSIEHIREYITPEMRAASLPREYSVECINDIARRAKDEGFLVAYNHPVWSCQNYADYGGLKGFFGVEIFNTGCAIEGYPDTEAPFHDLLREGERVYPLATDDNHNIGDCFGGYVMIKAEKLDYETIINALEKGDFYASTGPVIEDITLDDNGDLTVVCPGAASVSLISERRFAKRVYAQSDIPMGHATFHLQNFINESNENSFFRVTVYDTAGRKANTRGYFFEEWQHLRKPVETN